VQIPSPSGCENPVSATRLALQAVSSATKKKDAAMLSRKQAVRLIAGCPDSSGAVVLVQAIVLVWEESFVNPLLALTKG
jgi:hypothetical protein